MLVGHAHVFGARVGAERLLTLGNDPMLNASMLDLPNVDYVALGHIHKHQAVVTGRAPIVYAGSINRVDFSEEDEKKGFVLVELQAAKASGSLSGQGAPVPDDPRRAHTTPRPTRSSRRSCKAGPKVRRTPSCGSS